jgi:hypothetical protein
MSGVVLWAAAIVTGAMGGACSGPYVGPAAGGGSSGTGAGGVAGALPGVGGAPGLGGAGAAGSGGAGGAGCAPLFAAPADFRMTTALPLADFQTTTGRYYWTEMGTQLHWAPSDAPTDHSYPTSTLPISSAASGDYYQVVAGDQLIVAFSSLNSPPANAIKPDGTKVGTFANDGGEIRLVALDASSTAYLIVDPVSDAPAILQWQPPAAPTPVLYFSNLGIDVGETTQFAILGTDRFIITSPQDVWMVDLSAPTDGAMHLVGLLPQQQIIGLALSTAGMLLTLNDARYYLTGRDLFSPFVTGSPIDLQMAIDALPPPAGCAQADHHYAGAGTLYGSTYIYEGQGGLYLVTIDATTAPPTVSHPLRLTNVPLSYPRVTGDGVLFAVRNDGGATWYFDRVGQL